MAGNAIIYTGGIYHPFEESAGALAAIIGEAGIAARASLQLDEVLAALSADPSSLLVVYALRWSMTQHEKYAPDRARWALALPEAARRAIAGHVRAGGGLLGLHTASICFDDWQEWGEVLGGAWTWGTSFHPPLGPVRVHLDGRQALAHGLEGFELTDEAYSQLRLAPGVEVCGWVESTAAPGSTRQPAVWTHRYGNGRAVYDSLGHDAASLQHPIHRRLLRRAALWASGRPADVVEAA